jgi:hypothetical protein
MEYIEKPVRPGPLRSGPERDQLESWLAYCRTTLISKCAGLNIDQLKIRLIPTSSLTLLGLMRHMTIVEQVWFDARFAGHDSAVYYGSEDDGDADFNDLDSAPLSEVLDNFQSTCARSNELARGHDLSEMVASMPSGRELVDLRWIYIHMIEEYARHLGHADLLRESIDGEVGY